jgi:phage shock protein PspC (stress-responsive transcriptional regulator)
MATSFSGGGSRSTRREPPTLDKLLTYKGPGCQWVRSSDLTTHTSLLPIRRGFEPGFVNYKKGALDWQSQVIQLTSCLSRVGGLVYFGLDRGIVEYFIWIMPFIFMQTNLVWVYFCGLFYMHTSRAKVYPAKELEQKTKWRMQKDFKTEQDAFVKHWYPRPNLWHRETNRAKTICPRIFDSGQLKWAWFKTQ